MNDSLDATRPRDPSPRARLLWAALAAALLIAPATAAAPAAHLPGLPAPPEPGPGPGPASEARAAPGPAARSEAARGPAAAQGGDGFGYQYFTGNGFDTCEAPSQAVMEAWLESPYRAVGVYFGGRGRGCPVQPNLTAHWVASVHAQGWRLLPVFVGSQAPCVFAAHKKHVPIGDDPWTQGTEEGVEAVRAAGAIGIGPASALYLDMEAYALTDRACADTTLLFVRAWNREVRRQGYLPGFYSSADSGVRHMEEARKAGVVDLPSVIWFARWLGAPALYSESALPLPAWLEHGRVHQYAGNVRESHGGRTLTIDRNAVDGPVAAVATPTLLAP
ncbi:DUF1906 domain-containing protein [Streptomyces sp. NBC_01216]|uniref:DUF1906 domain-containing protein n=1 Tax=unclassified Streptomyces TaxID=2593676 RepID=UPI002E0D1421|nr:DUF1906 domain-containing protein [Streptomyces sp. NBC_01216]